MMNQEKRKRKKDKMVLKEQLTYHVNKLMKPKPNQAEQGQKLLNISFDFTVIKPILKM